jgi:Trp operon repressor
MVGDVAITKPLIPPFLILITKFLSPSKANGLVGRVTLAKPLVTKIVPDRELATKFSG